MHLIPKSANLSREDSLLLRLLISRRVLWCLITLVWAAQIYHFSTSRYSSDVSWSLLEQLLQKLHLTAPSTTISAINLIVRKLAHLIEYCVLTLLLYRSIAGERPLRWRSNLAFWCIAIAGLYAVSDEFHQVFVPGRRAALLDWVIDFAGAAFAMLMLHGCFRFFAPKVIDTPPLIETTTS